MNARKFELPNEEIADQFKMAVVRKGGDAYKYPGAATVVMRGPVPDIVGIEESPWVSEYDVLMLNVAGV